MCPDFRDYGSRSAEWNFGYLQQRMRCFAISIQSDNLLENTQEFFVDLSSTSVGVELTTSTATVFIIDQDSMLMYSEYLSHCDYNYYSSTGSCWNWLWEFRIQYKLVLTVFKCLHGLAPVYLSELISTYNPGRSLRSIVMQLCYLCQGQELKLLGIDPLKLLDLNYGMDYPHKLEKLKILMISKYS